MTQQGHSSKAFGAFSAEARLDVRDGIATYAARHRESGAAVWLYAPQQADPTLREAWISRLKALHGLNQAHLLTFRYVGETPDGIPYAVVPNRPSVRLFPPITNDFAHQIADQIGAALHAAHAAGIAHGGLTAAYFNKRADGKLTLRGMEASLTQANAETVRADFRALAALLNDALGQAAPPLLIDLLKAEECSLEAIKAALRGESPKPLAPKAAAASETPAPTTSISQTTRPVRLKKRHIGAFGLGTAFVACIITVGVLVAEGRLELPLLAQQPSPTATETATSTATATATATHTATPTDTPTNTPTFTATFTATATQTASATATSTPTLTATSTTTETAVPSQTPTASATSTPFETATPTLFIPTDLPTQRPSLTPLPTTPPRVFLETRPCVALVGDSVTHGGVTYQVPGTGYIVALTEPLSAFVTRELAGQGLTDYVALDRGASHTGVSTANHPSYFTTGVYQSLIEDFCRYTFVMPWLNDITPELPPIQAAERHAQILGLFAQELSERNPWGRVVIMNYYTGATAPFALETWARGFTPENVLIYNDYISQSCATGVLSKIRQVICVKTDTAFAGMGNLHVIGPTSIEAFRESIISQLRPDQDDWLLSYRANNPSGLLLGDGVHLSEDGKAALARYLVLLVRTLPLVDLE